MLLTCTSSRLDSRSSGGYAADCSTWPTSPEGKQRIHRCSVREPLGDRLGRLAQRQVELGELAGGAHRAEHLAHPDLVAEPLALLGVVHRQTGLHDEHLEQLALLAVRDPVARAAGRPTCCRAAGRWRSTAARRARRAGARSPAPLPGSKSGTQADSSSASGIRSCGTKRSTPHSSAWANSLKIEATGVRRPMICSRTSSGPATVGHHEGLALEARDRRDAVAEHLDHAAGDLVEHLGQVRRRVDAQHQLVESADPLSARGLCQLHRRGPLDTCD